jgi:hypothetical protein
MRWATNNYRIIDAGNIPCFIISDTKELLITMQKNDEGKDNDGKNRSRTVVLWTNYVAFVEALQMLFSKLNETGKTFQQIYART